MSRSKLPNPTLATSHVKPKKVNGATSHAPVHAPSTPKRGKAKGATSKAAMPKEKKKAVTKKKNKRC